jgi:methyl-accepting chemotaxis protein
MRNWSIARKLSLVFALGPLALIIIGLVAYRNTIAMLDSRVIIQHTYEVRATIARLSTQAVNAETGQRGYLLTGDNSYLAPYQEGVGGFLGDLSLFTRLTADNPHQQDRAQTLKALFGEKQRELAATIDLRRQHGLAAALPVVRSGRGKDVMDQIRTVLASADREEDQLQSIRDAAARSASEATLNTIVFGTLFTVLVLIVIAILSIRSLSAPIEQAIAALSAATAEIVAGTTQQAAGVQEQAAAVTETVATVEEITQTAEQSKERAKAVADSSRRAGDGGAVGRRSVESTIAVMGDIKTRTESIAQSILTLAEQAQAIGEIITVVNDLAEQTNILALNASIEATRAGEQGKGFSVVAAEIKALADQSKKSTVQVRQILSEIQKSTNAAVMATEQGTKSVDEAMRIVNEADEAIRMLVDTIVEAAQASTSISTSVGQQAVGMSQIQSAMRNIDQATSQNLASTQQAEAAARNLDVIGLRLRTLVRGTNGVAHG